VAHEITRKTLDQTRAREGKIVNVKELDTKQPAQSQIHNVKVKQKASTVKLRRRRWQESRSKTIEQASPIKQNRKESGRKRPHHRLRHSILQHFFSKPKSKPEKLKLVNRR